MIPSHMRPATAGMTLSLILALSAHAVQITVDPAKVVGKAGPNLYGVNIFRGFDLKTATNPDYQRVVRSLGCETIRFHHAGMYTDGSKSWMDANWTLTGTRTWNREKLKALFGAFQGIGSRRMVTLIMWPPWMDEDGDGRLDEGREEDFAAWCAELVKIVNLENKADARYWEVLNEMDLKKGYKGDPRPLCKAVDQAAIAMKKVDPKIQVSGNAWAWAPQKYTADFMTGAPAAHDFFSYHNYSLNNPSAGQAEIRARASKIADSLERVAALPGLTTKEIWLDEWNMFGNYSYDEKTKHMASVTAALYDLMVYKALASKSASATVCAWNEYDGAYGKIGSEYKVRETGKLMAAMNAHFKGNMVDAQVSDAESAVAFAVQNQGRIHLAVGNLREEPLTVTIANLNRIGSGISRRVRDDGNTEQVVPIQGAEVTIEAGRVAILDLGAKR